jgi:hypothetical protein
MTSHQYELFADYSQFYLQDDDQELGNLSEAWTDEAVDRLLAVAPGVVGIGTIRATTVPVTIEVHDNEPEADLLSWDHIAECDLEVKTGRVVVAGCTDYLPDAVRMAVSPGLYRARASYGGLDSLSEDGLEGGDHYRVQLWPVPGPSAARLIKRRGKP